MTVNVYAKLALDLKVWCSLGDIGVLEELQSQFRHILEFFNFFPIIATLGQEYALMLHCLLLCIWPHSLRFMVYRLNLVLNLSSHCLANQLI